MTKRGRIFFGVPLAFILCAALASGRAEAHGWWARVEVRTYPPPPPPPVYVPAQPVYVPAPRPVVYVAPPAPPSPWPRLGVGLAGLVSTSEGVVSGGSAGTLQLRTSPNSLFYLELQASRAERSWDGLLREDVAGLMGARFYLWDGFLTPYLDLAAGFGEASFHCCAYSREVSQFIGRYGLGLELRLGDHLAFETQIAQVHRLRTDEDPAYDLDLADHERAVEVRGGITFRF